MLNKGLALRDLLASSKCRRTQDNNNNTPEHRHVKPRPLMEGMAFQLAVGVLVCLNAVVIGLDTDFNHSSDGSGVIWVVLDNLFCVVWLVEMCLRMKFERLQYFRSLSNLLDFFLAMLGVCSAWVLPAIAFQDDGSGNTKNSRSVLQIVKIVRVMRLLRLLKLAQMFKELWHIVNGFLEALRTLGWVLLLLVVVIYAGGIFMTIIVGHTCDSDYSEWEDCREHFGKVWLSMYTLFQVMTFESWSTIVARPVLRVKVWLVFFFLPFLLLTSYGLLNIIVGVIVENTLNASNEKRRAEQELLEAQMRQELLTLRALFEEADEDGNGNVDLHEFKSIMARKEVQRSLKDLELPVDYPERLFECIDQDESGAITIDEFIDGALKLKEMPSASDMRTAVMQIQLVAGKVQRLEVMVQRLALALGLRDGVGSAIGSSRASAQSSSPSSVSSRCCLKARPDRDESKEFRAGEKQFPEPCEHTLALESTLKPRFSQPRQPSTPEWSPRIDIPEDIGECEHHTWPPGWRAAAAPPSDGTIQHLEVTLQAQRLESLEKSVGRCLVRLEELQEVLAPCLLPTCNGSAGALDVEALRESISLQQTLLRRSEDLLALLVPELTA